MLGSLKKMNDRLASVKEGPLCQKSQTVDLQSVKKDLVLSGEGDGEDDAIKAIKQVRKKIKDSSEPTLTSEKVFEPSIDGSLCEDYLRHQSQLLDHVQRDGEHVV